MNGLPNSVIKKVKCPDGVAAIADRKFGMQRDINVDRIAMFVLRLPESIPAIAHVLRTESNCIFTTAARVEQQVKCEACLAANRVSIAILRDLFGSP